MEVMDKQHSFHPTTNKRTLGEHFWGVGLNSTCEEGMGCLLTATCEYLFFEKVRFENNLIFLYFMDAEFIQFFV